MYLRQFFITYGIFISCLDQMFAVEQFHNNNNTQYPFGILHLNTTGNAATEYLGGVCGIALEQGESRVHLSFSLVVFYI